MMQIWCPQRRNVSAIRPVPRATFGMAAIASVALVLTPSTADAAVACGQTITASTTLTMDLSCPGNGIFVDASGVTLDLGGRTITGPPPSGSFIRGIDIRSGRTGVRVVNGTIRGFDRAVNISSRANGATLSGLTLDANGLGVGSATDSSNAHIAGNTILNTTQFSAMQLGGTAHRVEGNVMANGASTAIFLSGNQNVIAANRISEMGASGITIGAFPSNPGPFMGNQVTNNQISGSSRVFTSASISVTGGSGTVVEGNTMVGRLTTPGVFVNNSASTVVARNNLTAHRSGVLIRGTSSNTQVVGNSAVRNNFAGIAVESSPAGTVVSSNVANDNSSNGISVSSPATTITGNTATGNGNLGIFAVAGVTDGGGNHALGNGNPAQCSPTVSC